MSSLLQHICKSHQSPMLLGCDGTTSATHEVTADLSLWARRTAYNRAHDKCPTAALSALFSAAAITTATAGTGGAVGPCTASR